MENRFNQLCVWPGVCLGNSTAKDVEDLLKKYFDVRIRFAEQVITCPDIDQNGIPIVGTGGRTDILFYIHDEDIEKFAIPRFQIGVRWWEDVVSYNNGSHLYDKEILKKYAIKW